jgi:hypothetical protein
MNEDNQNRSILAIVIITVGVILLMGELGIGLGFNWWAIFVAVPGLIMLRNVYRIYQQRGKLDTNDFVQAGIGGLIVLMAVGWLLGASMSFLWNLWPLALIAIGVGMILRGQQSE